MKPNHLNIWSELQKDSLLIKQKNLCKIFLEHPKRGQDYSVKIPDFYFDYSKTHLSQNTLSLLIKLADEMQFEQKRAGLFSGEKINITEHRSVLHTALRSPKETVILVDGKNVVTDVHVVLDKMKYFATKIRNGEWKGFSGKKIKNIINIGIGGSDLGPQMVYLALKDYSDRSLLIRCISNVDAVDFYESVFDLNPEETLFIISSKTFTTLETMTNAYSARQWILSAFQQNQLAVANHFVAVSTNMSAVQAFGIDTSNIFEFWDWVGGRYSVDSSIGLILMIALGEDQFTEFLCGFHRIDNHFLTAPPEKNIPLLLGLITFWYINFFGISTVAVLPYDQYLKRFPAYLQQLTMESNGKSVHSDGSELEIKSSPVYWGEPGTNGQHSFYQLLHQGTSSVLCDFIGFCHSLHPLNRHHDILMANLFAQSEALAFGKSKQTVENEGTPDFLVPHRVFKGNHPSHTLLIDKLTPKSLGSLIAIYEHSVFVQGVLMGINSFDQWGVELGKELAKKILSEFEIENYQRTEHDSSTNSLIDYYKSKVLCK